MDNDSLVLFETRDDGIATITLNRPEKRNAITKEIIDLYGVALRKCQSDDAVKVIITKANGPTFCAGMDLYYLRDHEQAPGAGWASTADNWSMSQALKNCTKPTIGQVQGYSLGAGLSLALALDILVVAEDAQLGMPEVLRGSFGAKTTGDLVNESIPRKRVLMIEMLGRNVTGLEAVEMGLANFVLPESELDAFTLKLAASIAQRDPVDVAREKLAFQLDLEVPASLATKIDFALSNLPHGA